MAAPAKLVASIVIANTRSWLIVSLRALRMYHQRCSFCCRFIRSGGALPLVSRGFSAAYSVWTKCSPDCASGTFRVLDHTYTR